MYDKLLEKIKDLIPESRSNMQYYTSSVLAEAADAIEELSKRRWIPVTERLPEKTGVYLAWMKWDLTEPEEEPSAYPIEYDAEEEAFGWWKSYYDAETFGWAGEDFIRYEGITHWMPLPEPPKEET